MYFLLYVSFQKFCHLSGSLLLQVKPEEKLEKVGMNNCKETVMPFEITTNTKKLNVNEVQVNENKQDNFILFLSLSITNKWGHWIRGSVVKGLRGFTEPVICLSF